MEKCKIGGGAGVDGWDGGGVGGGLGKEGASAEFAKVLKVSSPDFCDGSRATTTETDPDGPALLGPV